MNKARDRLADKLGKKILLSKKDCGLISYFIISHKDEIFVGDKERIASFLKGYYELPYGEVFPIAEIISTLPLKVKE